MGGRIEYVGAWRVLLGAGVSIHKLSIHLKTQRLRKKPELLKLIVKLAESTSFCFLFCEIIEFSYI